MKRYFKLAAVLMFFICATIVLSGCDAQRKEINFKGEEGSLTFNVKEDSGCKLSMNKDDFRTSREQGTLICKDFKIGIEFNDDYGYFFKGDFNKLKAARKDNEAYKEVTYGDYKGVQYFYGGYMCHNIILNLNSKEYMLELSVYGKEDNEKSANAAIKNEEVLDVLNNITNIKAVK